MPYSDFLIATTHRHLNGKSLLDNEHDIGSSARVVFVRTIPPTPKLTVNLFPQESSRAILVDNGLFNTILPSSKKQLVLEISTRIDFAPLRRITRNSLRFPLLRCHKVEYACLQRELSTRGRPSFNLDPLGTLYIYVFLFIKRTLLQKFLFSIQTTYILVVRIENVCKHAVVHRSNDGQIRYPFQSFHSQPRIGNFQLPILPINFRVSCLMYW